jgi:hypothetical protein
VISGLHHGADPDADQQRRADPAGQLADPGGQPGPDDQADDGHAGLEQTEHQRHPQPGPRGDPAEADADGGGQVGQANRGRDEQEGEHSPG